MNFPETDEIRAKIKELLSGQQLAVLASLEDKGPYTSLIAFTADPDLRYLLFATDRNTRKFANICFNNRVSLLVDDGKNDDSDLHQAAAVTILGTARTVEGESRTKFAAQYLAKHPNLEDFVGAKTCALILVEVDVYYLVEKFQNISELHIRP